MALLGAAAAVLFAVAATVAGPDGDGPGPRSPGTDIGDHVDAGALGEVVNSELGGDRGTSKPPSPDTTCAGEARRAYGRGLGPFVYAATLRWHATPAVVLAYRVDGAASAGLDHRVLVLSSEGCQLLVAQSL